MSMELTVNVNGNNCQVKFEPSYHTFERVIKLLKSNNLIPPDMPFEKIQVIGVDGRTFKKQHYVRDCLPPNPQTKKCSVKIKFLHKMPEALMSSTNINQNSSQIRKTKLVDIVKSFFQKMENRQFRKLDKYENHQEEIISAIAKFGKYHQRLYAHFLFYKETGGILSQQEREELLEYKEKFSQMYHSIGNKMKQSLYFINQNEKKEQNVRSKENQSLIQSLKQKMEMQSMELSIKQQQYHELNLRFDEILLKYKELEQQLVAGESRITDAKMKLANKQKMIKELTASNEQLKSSNEVKKKDIEKMSNVMKQSQIRVMEQSNHKDQLQKQRQNIKKQREIQKKQKQVLKKQRQTLIKQIESLTKQVDNINKQKKKMIEKIDNLEKQKKNKEEEKKKLHEKINNLEKEKVKAQEKFVNYEKQKGQMHKKLEINLKIKQNAQMQKSGLLQSIQNLTEELNKLHTQNQTLLKRIQEMEKQSDSLRQDFLEQNQKITAELNQLKKQKQQTESKMSKRKSKSSIILQLKRSQSKVAFTEQIKSSSDALYGVGFQKSVVQSFRSKFSDEAKKSFTNATLFLHHTENIKLSSKKITQSLRNRPNILFIGKTISNKIVGAFTSLPIDRNSINLQNNQLLASKAFLFNIQKTTVNLFGLKKGRQPIQFDEQFLVFGEEQLTLQYETLTLESRFVTNPSNDLTSFNSTGYERSHFLHQKSDSTVSKVLISEYWLFQCTLK